MPPVKTIGNSSTAPRDLVTDEEVKITLYALCDSVAARRREQRSVRSTVQLGIRDTSLLWYERQAQLPRPACDSTSIFGCAFVPFRQNRPRAPVRSLSVRASGLEVAPDAPQLSLFEDDNRRQRRTDLENAVDHIRNKYGYGSIRRGIMLTDPTLDLDAKGSNTIHPIGFLSTLN